MRVIFYEFDNQAFCFKSIKYQSLEIKILTSMAHKLSYHLLSFGNFNFQYVVLAFMCRGNYILKQEICGK